MRSQKIVKTIALILLIAAIVFLAIDIIKSLTISFNYMGMQSSERISLSSNVPEIRYEPTDYEIVNKDDVLEQIKKIALDLKNNKSSKDVEGLVEIGNIHKIEGFFYEYEQYAVVKYKLLNIIEDLPKLYKATKGLSNEQLINYFDQNAVHVENYYGIVSSEEFISLVKSLSFLNNKIGFTAVRTATIEFDYDHDVLLFNLRVDAGEKTEIYSVKAEYYRSTDNQVKPYVTFKTIV